MAASDTQVGGNHYHDMGEFQPWDVLKHWLTPEEYRGYQKGVAIAYLARERAKGGDQDIAKAAHHLQKLIEVMGEQAARAVDKATGTLPLASQGAAAVREIPYCRCAVLCAGSNGDVKCRHLPTHPKR